MTKISHFEVYVDGGDGWKLLQRYAQEERSKAFNLAKDKEKEKFAVKVIKEVFDSSDSSYAETVEYVKGLKNAKKPYFYSNKHIADYKQGKLIKEKINVPKATQAVFILLMIIAMSAVVVNFLGTLALPLFEIMLPAQSVRSVYFVALFILFILIAFPLMLKKVPWQDLSVSHFNKHFVSDEMFLYKAKSIVDRYNLNEDFADYKTPIAPDANAADKRMVINFMAQILGALSVDDLNSFNKLGVKLIIYGAILEYAHYKKLHVGQLNILLSEAIAVMDGPDEDLVKFYQAKRAYKDTKQALFLTGLGAFLMDRCILKNPVDQDLLINGMKKWQTINSKESDAFESASFKTRNKILVPNIITINHNIKFFDASSKANGEKKQVAAIENIARKLARKLDGKPFVQIYNQISFSFVDLSVGIAFAKQVLNEINEYIYQLHDSNIIFNVKINLVKKQTNNNNDLYIKDILEFTNDDEILTTANIANEAKGQTNLEFISLGKKLLPNAGKTVELFKIV